MAPKQQQQQKKFDHIVSYSKRPVAAVNVYPGHGRNDLTVDEMLDELEKQEVRSARKETLLGQLRERVAGMKPEHATPTTPKKYLVDQQTGRIEVAEDGEGEYTHKDALLVSASIKSSQGPSQYDNVVELLRAFKEISEKKEEEAPKPSIEKPKEFYVDEETGIIVHDSENGEYTLSEARAVSQSKQRAMVSMLQQPSDPITPDKLELFKRDILDEAQKQVAAFAMKPKDNEAPPFITDPEGNIVLNPGANVPGYMYMLYELIKQFREDRKQKETGYQGADGSVRPLPDWLEIKKWEKEEERKDERNKGIVKLMEEGRKELPGLLEGLKSLSRSKESTEAMQKGGWLESKGQSPKTDTSTVMCAGCGSPMTYSSAPALITCKCGTLNFMGTSEQFEEIKKQLAPETQQEGKWESEPHSSNTEMDIKKDASETP